VAGLSAAKGGLLEESWGGQGDRFDGANYPTPEGECPLCAVPEIRHDIVNYQRVVAERFTQPREPLHQSVGLAEHSISPSLAATER